ncbi:MAG TPA: 50S ribosomal protein L13 [Candidatus Paceibacterota bacterium]|nr:50S ribosomal protein L13 [Candidatus Paceibacterota bacterium]
MTNNKKTKEYTFNAKGKKLGRLASKIAHVLQGKDDPSYDPSKVADRKVIVKNIDELEISGKKFDQKIYYKHSGRPGHLSEKKYGEVFEKDPEWIIRHAVRLMLPKNRLTKKRLANMIVEK